MDYLRLAVEGNRTFKDIVPKLQGFAVAANIANTAYLLGLIAVAFIVAIFAYFIIRKVI